jgi:hypothetical protein
MDIEQTIRDLRSVAEKHKNDFVPTFGIRVADMASDCAKLIERMHAELMAYRATDLTGPEIVQMRREWRDTEKGLRDNAIRLQSELERIKDRDAERDEVQKAFALACRILDDRVRLCPTELFDVEWPECDGEAEQCGDGSIWECWQKYIMERVKAEQVCRICGCTQDNACPGGCFWVEDDLCSECAGVEDGAEEQNDRDDELPPGVELPVDIMTGDIIYDEGDEELFDGGEEVEEDN